MIMTVEEVKSETFEYVVLTEKIAEGLKDRRVVREGRLIMKIWYAVEFLRRNEVLRFHSS
jgi:hypothetical protein